MNDMMLEATRLTRANRLVEATALIQRMLRGEREPSMAVSLRDDIAFIRNKPPNIERKSRPLMKRIIRPQTHLRSLSRAISELCAIKHIASSGPQGPDYGGGCTSPCGYPRRTSCQRAESSLKQLIPTRRETRAYKLYIPSRYQGQALPLIVMLHGGTQTPDDFAAGTRMNLIAEDETVWWFIPRSPAMRTQQSVGTGFAQTTSAGVEVNLRSSLASPAKSCTITPSIRSASTWVDCQPEPLRPPSWGQPTRICMRLSEYILVSPLQLRTILSLRLPRCGKAFECSSEFGQTSAVFQDERTVPTIVFHGDRDAIVHPRNADNVIALFYENQKLAKEGASRTGIWRTCLYSHDLYR